MRTQRRLFAVEGDHSAQFSSSYLTAASPGTLGPQGAGSALTLSLWLRPDSLPAATRQDPLSKQTAAGGPANQDYTLLISDTTGKYVWYGVTAAGNSNTALTNITPVVGQWDHLVLSLDNTGGGGSTVLGANVYRGGANIAAVTASIVGQPQNNTGHPFLLGYNLESTAAYLGRVDKCGVWNRMLLAGEETALDNGGASLDYAHLPAGLLVGLQAWWDFDENTGAVTWADRRGVHPLTATGTVTARPGAPG